jgi:hypothetical protein
MIDALLQLGQEQRIPVGIEYIDAAAFRSRITVHEQGTTVGKLLDTITHPLGYSWFVDGDVVMVTHSGAPQCSKNQLDSRIPEFTVKRDATLQAASLQLLPEALLRSASARPGNRWRLPKREPAVPSWAVDDEERHGSPDSQPYRFAAQQRRVGRPTSTVEYGQGAIIRCVEGVRVRRKQ